MMGRPWRVGGKAGQVGEARAVRFAQAIAAPDGRAIDVREQDSGVCR